MKYEKPEISQTIDLEGRLSESPVKGSSMYMDIGPTS